MFAEQIKPGLQAIGDVHVLTVRPEWRVVALGDLIVGDDEVADMRILSPHQVIERTADARGNLTGGQ